MEKARSVVIENVLLIAPITEQIRHWAQTLQNLASNLRFHPFDTSTNDGRAKERKRRVLLTAVSGVFSKSISLLTTLITVPVTVHYLGQERYGLWMTISSFITLMSFADLGLGNGLVNAISRADGASDRELARRSVSAGFFMLLVVSAGLGVLFAMVYPFVSWERIFNVETDIAKTEVGLTVVIFFVAFLVGLPFGIVQRVQVGYQEGFAGNIWQAAGNILALVLVLVAVHLQAGLPLLVAAMLGGQTLVLLVNFGVHFTRSRPWLMPTWREFSFSQADKLMRTGLLFFVLQTLTLVGASTDNLVITQTLGPAAVATYTVCMRLAMMLSITQFFIIPLWPAFGEAMARGDFQWAERAMWRTLRFTLMIAVPMSILMLVFGKWIISVWVGPAVVPSTILLAGFAGWTLLAGYGGTLAVFLNSGSWLSRQVKLYTVATLVSLILKLVLVRRWGEGGVVWATVLAYGVLFIIPATQLVKRIFREHTVQPGGREWKKADD